MSWCLALVLLCALSLQAQRAVFVTRHAEKQDPDDNAPAAQLSETGHARAQRLAEMLRGAGVKAIYVTDTVRARQTAAPLAAALKIELRTYDAKDSAGLARRLREHHKDEVVLVVGHSNTVPLLVESLGHNGERAAGDYGWLHLVVPGTDNATLLSLRY